MELEAAKMIGAGLAVIGVIGPGIGIGWIFASFITAVGRNPAARGEVFPMSMLGFALLDPIAPAFLRYRPQLLMLGGLAHHGLGQTEKAKPYLEGVQRVQGHVAASKLLAQIYLAEGNTDRARSALGVQIDDRFQGRTSHFWIVETHYLCICYSLAVSALLFQLFQHVHLSTALKSASSVPNTGGRLPRTGTNTNSSSSLGADIPAVRAWWSGPRSARSLLLARDWICLKLCFDLMLIRHAFQHCNLLFEEMKAGLFRL